MRVSTKWAGWRIRGMVIEEKGGGCDYGNDGCFIDDKEQWNVRMPDHGVCEVDANLKLRIPAVV